MTTRSKSRRKESADYWQNHVTAWEQSGQSLKAYGESHGLARSTWSRWCRRLRGSSDEMRSLSPRLARVQVISPLSSPGRCRLELPNGIGIEWPLEAEIETLWSILEVSKRWV